MMTANDTLPERVLRLETSVQSICEDLADVRRGQESLGGKLDQVVAAVTSTDGRAAERAHAVKLEIRDEADRKARERSELFKNALALLGGMSLIVAAIGGPYAAKLEETKRAGGEATSGLAQVREVIAADHAEIVRNHDAIEIAREKNRLQDDRLLDAAQRLSHLEARD